MNRAEILEWAGTRISPPDQRYVLLAIASACDETTYRADLSDRTITKMCGVSGHPLREAVCKLIDRKLITSESRNERGAYTYQLLIEGDTTP